MIILGIDPALANTGLCRVDTSSRVVLAQSTIKTPPGLRDDDRILMIASGVIRAMADGVEGVACEEQWRVNTAKQGRGESNAKAARGVEVARLIWWLAEERQLPFAWVQIEAWKRGLGLPKGAKGSRVTAAVKRTLRWPAERGTEHAAAAGAIGMCGERVLRARAIRGSK